MSFESTPRKAIMDYLLHLRYCYFVTVCGNEHQSGVPDILVCYKGVFIGLEVKGPNGSLRMGQRIRLRKIQKAKGIGEAVHGVKRVKEIIACIDAGGTWENRVY